jgi:type VI secretion system secreted protein VgrG
MGPIFPGLVLAVDLLIDSTDKETMVPVQTFRNLKVETPLGPDVLLLHSFTCREELGRPFEMVLSMQSVNPLVDFSKILGQKVTVTVDLPTGGNRYFNGYVRDFEQDGYDAVNSLASYRAVVVPWLSLLKLPTDCRTYQGKTIPDILREVFGAAGFSDHRFNLTHLYVPREFCVQYRESTFDFVSRLMEFAGIYYYFEHEKGKHTMVLCDSPAAHSAFPGYGLLSYNPLGGSPIGTVQKWGVRQTLCPGTAVLDDYDYTIPKTDLRVSKGGIHVYAQGAYEHFDAPGGFQDKSEGEQFVRIRREELVCEQSIGHGSGDLLGIAAGHRFTLMGFLRPDQNAEYLVASATLEITSPTYSADQNGPVQSTQRCDFTTIPSSIPFRTKRTTPKPRIAGIQTAVVTGPLMEEVYPSALGSVTVQFRWDRNGKSDQNSSVWIRVTQLSAGNNWGSMFIPHVGNEVAVAFEEGDPDRPVIIGSLYNANNQPPLPLPFFKTLSYISDRLDNAFVLKGDKGIEGITLTTPYQQAQFSIGAGLAPGSPVSPDEATVAVF